MRRIKKQFWLSEQENKEFMRKVNLTGLPQSTVFKILITGYEPQVRVDERFFDVMNEMYAIGNNLNQIVRRANSLGFVDVPELKVQLEKLYRFQSEVESLYLRPVKSKLKWSDKDLKDDGGANDGK